MARAVITSLSALVFDGNNFQTTVSFSVVEDRSICGALTADVVIPTVLDLVRIKRNIADAVAAKATEFGYTIDTFSDTVLPGRAIQFPDLSWSEVSWSDVPQTLKTWGWQKEFASNKNVVSFGTTFGLSQNGTDSVDSDVNGGDYIKYASSATINSVAGWASTVVGSYLKDRYRQSFAFKTPADITSYRMWVGCFSGGPMASDTPAVSLAAFRFSTSASDTNFMLCTSDGVSLTATASDVTVTALTRYVGVIDMSVSGEINFYLNQSYKGTLTTNLPATTTGLVPIAECRNLVGASREIHLSHMIAQSL